jgi:hypothetical protein
VSEERNQIQEEQSANLGDVSSWEAQVVARANELLYQRVAPLKAEIERLQTNISEILSRLNEEESKGAEGESSGLIDAVRQWFSDSTAKAEEDFKSRLEEARAEAEAARIASEEVERDFESKIEQACAEAAARARREAESQIEDLREQLEASRTALTMAVATSAPPQSQTVDFGAFKAAIEDVDSQRSQSETLAALVRRSAQFAPRVVFFVVKGGDAVGWKASGFENGLNDETVKLLSVPSQKRSFLREALVNLHPATWGAHIDGAGGSELLGLYSSPVPERAIAIPLVVLNKAVAVLYADSGTQSESLINTAALESLTRIAGRTIESMLPRRGAEPARAIAPQPQAPPVAAEASFAAAVSADVRTESVAIQQPIIHAEKSEIQVEKFEPEPKSEITIERRRTEDLPPLPPQAREIDDGLRQAEAQLPEPAHIETEPSVPESEPRRITKEVSETIATFNEHPASAPTVPISEYAIPPIEDRQAAPGVSAPSPPVFAPPPPPPPRPPQQVMAVPTPGSETEQRAHNDARRFARLLVSEIKLYNAAKVNDGRRNYDLYDRLKDEIDRSRKVYDKRVSPAVAARFDYFYDELVQTLAEGDPAKLGKNCPGPVVLA